MSEATALYVVKSILPIVPVKPDILTKSPDCNPCGSVKVNVIKEFPDTHATGLFPKTSAVTGVISEGKVPSIIL